MDCGKCSKPSRLVKFATFEYQYCDECKVEVIEAAQTEATPCSFEEPGELNHYEKLINEVRKYYYTGAQ